MTYTIPSSNWTTAALAYTIEAANSGDTIRVMRASQAALAKNAHQRMCPEKSLTFEFEIDDMGDDEDDD